MDLNEFNRILRQVFLLPVFALLILAAALYMEIRGSNAEPAAQPGKLKGPEAAARPERQRKAETVQANHVEGVSIPAASPTQFGNLKPITSI